MDNGFTGELVLRYRDKPVDGKWFTTMEAISYKSLNGKIYNIPAGTNTDFASIPRIMRWLIPRVGKYGKASVAHDYLCESAIVPRKEADRVFLEGMKRLGVRKIRRLLMYFGVAAYTATLGRLKKRNSDK